MDVCVNDLFSLVVIFQFFKKSIIALFHFFATEKSHSAETRVLKKETHKYVYHIIFGLRLKSEFSFRFGITFRSSANLISPEW